MSMDVSRLGIVVESQGIDAARKALDGGNGRGGLTGAADRAERSVDKLTATVGKLMSVNTSSFSTAMATSVTTLSSAVTSLSGNISTATKTLKEMTDALGAASKATDKASAAKREYSGHTGTAITTLKAMTTAALAYSAVNVAKSVVEQADAWGMMKARMQNATGSMHNANVATEQMLDLSQRLRVPLADSVKLYTRLAPAVAKMGKDSGYAKDMVEGISTALQLSGANGAEASSVMLQLSQSFSSGVLNGAEFNAVAENGSVLMRILEKETGKSTAELKKMGSTGKLSMEIVGAAIQKNLPELRDKFDKLPMTFEGAMIRLKNAWTKAVGEMGEDTKFNQALSGALRTIENMIPAVADGLGRAFIEVMAWVERNKAQLAEIWTQIKGIGQDLWDAANALVAFSGGTIIARDNMSPLAAMIFKVREFLAGSVDLLKVFAYFIAEIGIAVVELIVAPFTWVLKAVTKVEEAFGNLLETLSVGAKAMHMDGLSASLATASAEMKAIAEGGKLTGENIAQTFEDMHKKTESWVSALKSGNGELDTLHNLASDDSSTYDRIMSNRAKTRGSMDEKAFGTGKPKPKPTDPKDQKALDAEQSRYLKELESINAMLREQATLQQRMADHGADYEKLGPAQKKVIELQEHLLTLERAVGTTHANAATAKAIADQKALISLAEEAAALELVNQGTKARIALEKDIAAKHESKVVGLEAEAAKLKEQVDTYGMARGAVEALALAESERQLAMLKSAQLRGSGDEDVAKIQMLEREIAARKEIAAATEKLGQLDVEKQFDKLFDASKAEKFADALTEGFGRIGKATGGVIKSFQAFETRMSKIHKGWELYNKESDQKKRTKMAEKLYEEEANARLGSYADMAGAAKGYFKEGSKGYQALEAAEKTFRMFQMAMQLKSFVTEMFQTQALTTAKVASDQIVSGSDTSRTATEVANAQTRGMAKAAEAGANQASGGDPYTAFVRVAMMVALMASLGFAISGGKSGGASIAADRQASQGTGTVFGDSKAKSESLTKSLEMLSDIDSMTMDYSAQMRDSLKNIEALLSGITTNILRAGNITTGAGLGINTGTIKNDSDPLLNGFYLGITSPVMSAIDDIARKVPIIGELAQKLTGLWGGVSTEIVDAGVTLKGTIEDLMSGKGGSRYATVETTRRSWFGLVKDSTLSEVSAALEESVTRQFGLVFNEIGDSLKAAANVVGLDAGEIANKVNNFVVDLSHISLKDMNGDQISEAISSVVGASADRLAKSLFPKLEAFAKVGEGTFETLTRVVSSVETANLALEKLGVQAISYTQLVNRQGDIAAEIVKRSILANAKISSGMIEIIDTFSGTASEISDAYSALKDVHDALVSLHVAGDVSRDVIRAAGSLENLKSILEDYKSNFFSDAERQAMSVKKLQAEFAKLGLALPQTKDAFRALVTQLSNSGAAGEELAVKILGVAGDYASAYDEYSSMLDSAKSAVNDAYSTEIDNMQEYTDKFTEFSKTIGDFMSEMLSGNLSILDPTEKYRLAAQEFDSVLTKARSGDQDALAKFTDVSKTFLDASKEVNASGSAYAADFNRVYIAAQDLYNTTSATAAGGKTQVEILQSQLDAMNKQVDALLGVNNSVLSVEAAVRNLTALMSGGLAATAVVPAVNGSHANGLGYVPFDGYIAELHKGEAVLTAAENAAMRSDYSSYGAQNTVALVEEIKALRSEVKSLRDGQREQTGQLIAATYDSNERNAQAVVDGQRETASIEAYAERARATLV